ncbi:CLUMA_CG013524, isoform A [Clunio marinus]|uniref:CLUMA_CG013524, isoform A n=1 Tax=Clunio marinus TaxID=568069 RepID=A0A1J1IJ49_9DIPT|nr:CLUMA_CG013524, isoform A [Clunio marinus]
MGMLHMGKLQIMPQHNFKDTPAYIKIRLKSRLIWGQFVWQVPEILKVQNICPFSQNICPPMRNLSSQNIFKIA